MLSQFFQLMLLRLFLIELFVVDIDWYKIVISRIAIKVGSLFDLDAFKSKWWFLLTFQIEDIGSCLVPDSQQITESFSQQHHILASLTF